MILVKPSLLPAEGLGPHEPRRPYVTGGLGPALFTRAFIALMDYALYESGIGDALLTQLGLDNAAVVEAVLTSLAAQAALGDAAADISATDTVVSDGALRDESAAATLADVAAEAALDDDAAPRNVADAAVTVIALSDELAPGA